MANVTISNISRITSTTMIGYGGANVLLPLSGSSDGGTTWTTNVSTLSDIKTFMFRSDDINSNVSLVTTGNVSANNVIVSTDIDTTGNISANNVIVTTDMEVTGNVTAAYFLGNGSQLTGLGLHYGDSDTVNLLASFGSNTIETTGNVSGGNIIASTDVIATGNISANNISITSLLQLPAIDNATRNALDASVGQVVYSTDDDTIQVFLANSTWGNIALV